MRGTVFAIGLTLLLGVAACSPSPKPATGAEAASQEPSESPAVTPEPEAEPESRAEIESTSSSIEPATAAEIEPAPASPEPPPAPEYRIQPGDLLGVKFFFNPELNEEVTVRPDGRISLQLVPEMAAAGRTPSDLTRSLEDLYARELDNPEISVIVRTFSAHRVYVDGEVERPGELELGSGLTVLGAIASAQGMTDRAYKEQVVLIRRGKDGQPVASEMNVQQMRKGQAPDPLLMPYDVVFVPLTKISIWNKWLDQYVRRSIPVSFGFRVDLEEL